MLALFYLPGIPASRPNEGKQYILDQRFMKHVWRGPQGGPASLIFDLTDPAGLEAFHATATKLLDPRTVRNRIPLPFIFESIPLSAAAKKPAAPAPAPPAPPAPPVTTTWSIVPIPGVLSSAPDSTGVAVVGYALSRSSEGKALFRGLEDLWTESLPTDPFPTEADAQKALDAALPDRPAVAPKPDPKPAAPKNDKPAKQEKGKAKPKS